MSIEAMKQALEALEGSRVLKADYLTLEGYGHAQYLHNAAITALRQAIAQAEKQEPVAYAAVINGEIDWNADYPFSNEPFTCFNDENSIPLYAAPSRKEWVGLTDDEITELDYSGTRIDFVRAIEAKLKEKNT